MVKIVSGGLRWNVEVEFDSEGKSRCTSPNLQSESHGNYNGMEGKFSSFLESDRKCKIRLRPLKFLG